MYQDKEDERMTQETDVVVVGMGAGGERVAGRLAESGLDVVGVEGELVCGERPYWACVPSKMMLRAARLLAEARRVPGMAGQVRTSADYGPVATRVRAEAADDWNDQVAADRFTARGGRLARGHGRLAGPGRVDVDGEVFAARRGVVVATGSRPWIPPVTGLDRVPYWTHRDAVSIKEPPGSLIVLGGGVVGLELAQAFAPFGTAVTIVETQRRLLSAEEPEAGELIARVLRAEGLTVRTDTRAAAVRHRPDGFFVRLDTGEEITAEQLLVAAGRRANLEGLGLETVGLDPRARALEVDEQLLAAHALWAVGDVTGRGASTHMAMYQADIVVRAVLGAPGPDADYRALPRVTFTDPEVGAVGLTEAQAREKGLRVRTGGAELSSSARGRIHGQAGEGLVKLVEDADRGVLVGATAMGPAGSEVLYGLAMAVQAEVPVERLRHMIYAYPTFHRAVRDALAALC
ncbi:dihydrolipoyl dehydrogenase family protein [Streptomyces gobiensis]|uniref:dihydrolipoyl dehydrogenase family protein n=1 Tax=Streptomyces gobiensis TaxID=2875706 RepID=UPI001E4202A4|nr:NAD(P)/FAD-dependent oxidoreductase [Streptomyces gobiensis]UGY90946.1 NAD(P)/FAD-dependent oxidoreductase [Streptomyces gobiensis]